MKQTDTPWALSAETCLQAFQADKEIGLTQQEAHFRLNTRGLNVLKEEKGPSAFQKFFAQLKNPVVMALLIATLITFLLGEIVDSIAIISIVLINAWIGYLQEAKAEAAILALKQLSAPHARVLRDCHIMNVPASHICPGDILILEAGDYVAADARLLVAHQLSTDEAILTGESLPVEKQIPPLAAETFLAERINMVFAGTAVMTGSARAVVTATGLETEIGRIAGMLQSITATHTPLQIRLEQVSQKLLIFCCGVVTLVAFFGLLHGETLLHVLMTGISLAVAAIPEGLPAVVSITLTLAVRRMAKRNAIVKHLLAVETLGSTDVICTDKTGTLTTGKMRAREVVLPPTSDAIVVPHPALEHNPTFQRLLRSCILCSNAFLSASHESGDPTELALLHLAHDNHIPTADIVRMHPRLAEWSFDSHRKRMSVATSHGGHVSIHVKGAPESILPLCHLNDAQKAQIESAIETLSSMGRRLLMVASQNLPLSPDEFELNPPLEASAIEHSLEFLGLISIADPPRAESVSAIAQCQSAGIKVVMITGDHPATAKAIAQELGICTPNQTGNWTLSGAQLDNMSDEELQACIANVLVYARVNPEHKLRIVRAFKRQNAIVAMTGDGVNDAPALKEASIGISMGKGGSEVARQASSMILADDCFAVIVSAIEEGRAIYGNIRRAIQYLLSGNLSEILIMLLTAMMGWPTPLAPIHLLWINLVTDGLPSLALAAEPMPENMLAHTQRPSPDTFFDRLFYKEMLLVAFMTTALALGIYGWGLTFQSERQAKTLAFTFLVLAELFRSFASRSDDKTFFQLGLSSNPFHFAAVCIPSALQILILNNAFLQTVFQVQAIGLKEWGVVASIALIPLVVLEMRKGMKQFKQAKKKKVS